ncbi:TAXI family TRAP transporter solute-binding subunit [Candidatus Riflebacteria bacterium]
MREDLKEEGDKPRFKRDKYFLFSILFLILLVCIIQGCGGPSLSITKWSIGGGSAGGVYLPLATGISEIIKTNIAGVDFSAKNTGGSVENIRLLKNDKVQLAIVQHDVALHAYKGEENFVGDPFKQLRVVAEMYVEGLQIIARKKSKIKKLKHLRRKKVVLGPDKSGTYVTASRVFDEAGIFEKIEPVFERLGPALGHLEDGEVDAVCFMSGIPSAAVEKFLKSGKFRLISVPAKVIKRLKKRHPYYSGYSIRKGSYKGVKRLIRTIGIKALLVTTDGMQDGDISTIVKLLQKNRKKLKKVHVLGGEFNTKIKKNAMQLPVHNGVSNN